MPCPTAQSRHCVGGDVTHIHPCPNGLNIRAPLNCAVIDAVTIGACYGIPGKGDGALAGRIIAATTSN